jgi:tRNA pseudouridine55 synthase
MGRRNRIDKKRPVLEESGLVLVNKPKTWTSFDVVNFIRTKFNIRKVGHCGTLDPMATGLLIIVFGKFTKLSQRLSGEDKAYIADIQLGITTESYDLEGDIIKEIDASHITQDDIINILPKFTGDIQQIPPMHSALKKDGKKLCDLARQGIELELEARPITIYKNNIVKIDIPNITLDIKCSKGTYIRSLAHDIGNELGVGATLTNLHRTQSGKFNISFANEVEEIRNWQPEDLLKCSEELILKFQPQIDINKE